MGFEERHPETIFHLLESLAPLACTCPINAPLPPPTKPKFNSMSKIELEEYGRTLGVELDRRNSKDKLIAQLEALDK